MIDGLTAAASPDDVAAREHQRRTTAAMSATLAWSTFPEIPQSIRTGTGTTSRKEAFDVPRAGVA